MHGFCNDDDVAKHILGKIYLPKYQPFFYYIFKKVSIQISIEKYWFAFSDFSFEWRTVIFQTDFFVY